MDAMITELVALRMYSRDTLNLVMAKRNSDQPNVAREWQERSIG